MKYLQHIALVIIGILFLVGCEKAQVEKQLQKEIAEIEQYLANNNITAQQDSAARYYYRLTTDQSTGTFPRVGANLRLAVDYECQLLDGTIIYDSGDTPDTISLDNAIVGWQIALPKHTDVGDEIELWLPSKLTYGGEGNGTIPPNTPLFFRIALKEIDPHF